MIRSFLLRILNRHSSGPRILVLAFCGLGLLWFVTPRARAVFDSPGQNAALVQQSPAAVQANRQRKRNEEILQKKIDNPEAQDANNVYRHSQMVHTLARMLGLPVEVTSRMFEGLNFIVLLACIVWFLARALPKALHNRTQRIQSQLQQAHAATEEANQRLANVEARLGRLDIEIAAIKTHAHQEAHDKEKQMRAALEQEKQVILHTSAQEIAAAGAKAQSQLKRVTAEMAIERAKRKLALTMEADHSLVESFLVDLGRERHGNGVN
ncbi:MAG: ATPase [Acidobacteriaceae bacterium]